MCCSKAIVQHVVNCQKLTCTVMHIVTSSLPYELNGFRECICLVKQKASFGCGVDVVNVNL
jgi:hypothetical protein